MRAGESSDIYRALGVRPLINAKGPATRLSGGPLRPEVAAAMAQASQQCVDMAELQAAASRVIAKATGAEAGYVASGAAACLLLATAACMARLDPGRMARLPDSGGVRNQVIMVRSQRNFYDHAVRAAGATIVEVGLPDRHAGAGVRDAEAWEIADAISGNTAAIFYVADHQALPPLREVVAVARRHRVPLIVDAAAQVPPQANLRRFIAEGADLVAFSGGKVIGGPQASGFLCGRRDLVMSAALQHLDLDVFSDMWRPPPGLIDRRKLRGLPPHGIGRTCKAGKEEIVGLLTALRIFVAEGDATRHARWLAVAEQIAAGLTRLRGVTCRIAGAGDRGAVPMVELQFSDAARAAAVARLLVGQDPAIHVDAARRSQGLLDINPVCIDPGDIATLIGGIRKAARSAA
jgi:D-glucosaminate-6-phosphate ammonia-lyase